MSTFYSSSLPQAPNHPPSHSQKITGSILYWYHDLVQQKVGYKHSLWDLDFTLDFCATSAVMHMY